MLLEIKLGPRRLKTARKDPDVLQRGGRTREQNKTGRIWWGPSKALLGP